MGRAFEDFANIMLMFSGGMIGVIETNWIPDFTGGIAWGEIRERTHSPGRVRS